MQAIAARRSGQIVITHVRRRAPACRMLVRPFRVTRAVPTRPHPHLSVAHSGSDPLAPASKRGALDRACSYSYNYLVPLGGPTPLPCSREVASRSPSPRSPRAAVKVVQLALHRVDVGSIAPAREWHREVRGGAKHSHRRRCKALTPPRGHRATRAAAHHLEVAGVLDHQAEEHVAVRGVVVSGAARGNGEGEGGQGAGRGGPGRGQARAQTSELAPTGASRVPGVCAAWA